MIGDNVPIPLTLTGGSGGDTFDPHAQPHDIKKDVFAKQPGVWEAHGKAVHDLPDVSDTEAFIHREIFGMEGGMLKNKETNAVAGIMPKTFENLKAKGALPGLENVKSVDNLTPAQAVQVQRAYLDDLFPKTGGHHALDKIGDNHVAAAAADTLFELGGPDGTTIVQKAINAVAPDRMGADGVPGSRTLDALKEIAADRETKAKFLDALADMRNKTSEGSAQWRTDYYRYKDQR